MGSALTPTLLSNTIRLHHLVSDSRPVIGWSKPCIVKSLRKVPEYISTMYSLSLDTLKVPCTRHHKCDLNLVRRLPGDIHTLPPLSQTTQIRLGLHGCLMVTAITPGLTHAQTLYNSAGHVCTVSKE
jgi:hypothetical protein